MKTINLTVDAEGIALAAIDVPGQSMNVLTPQFNNDLATLIDKVTADADIKGLILTSGKPRAFIVGADIKDLLRRLDAGISASEGAAMSQALSRLLRRLETCGKPVACAINGLALGGGFELALACHYRVLAQDASVGLPEVSIGLLPGGGSTQRLPRLIGIEKASPILLGGRPLKAAEALELGLVHAVTPSTETVAAARRWLRQSPEAVQPWDRKEFRVPGGAGPAAAHATRSFTMGTALVAQNTQRNMPAPLAILSCLYEGTILPIDKALQVESKYFGQLLTGPVARNMMRTLFVNKNAADKLARRPNGIPPTKVKTVGILGAGLMGAGIAYVSSAAGINVVLLDRTLELAQKGKQYSANQLAKLVERGKTTQSEADVQLARIHPTVDYNDLASCELVIEAVFESRPVKAEVTGKAAAAMSATAIFASNTSTLPISGLAQNFPRAADFIGLHFFSPVDKMPLVEVIMGRDTAPATLARALDYAAQIRKTPIVVNDSPGFYTSRVFGAYFQEGLLLLEEGVVPALIENAARMAGMPVGPLAVSDEVSLDLQLKVIEQNLADGQAPTPQLLRVLKVLRNMVHEHQRTGRKAGGGFYDYSAEGKRLWPGLARLYPQAASQPDVEEVKRRLLHIQALETARCVEAGVVADPADADLGSILGIGFPAWTGGTLSYIDTIGLPTFVAQCEVLAQQYGPRFQPSAWLKAKAARGERFHPPLAAAA
ncbi:MAG: 3-hydroxyacyl-CoA dehydrogenase NAD-binding domain-containing protein [Sinobacteraceae bacterium]|nr:3-hydroxyacyl-CoA dehydrogenase NAD-binding domain-containing protein [Nevskiaceae bacterium]